MCREGRGRLSGECGFYSAGHPLGFLVIVKNYEMVRLNLAPRLAANVERPLIFHWAIPLPAFFPGAGCEPDPIVLNLHLH